MAPTTRKRRISDPEITAAERRRDRVAAQYEDGVANESALLAAEAALTAAIDTAERRAERAGAAARERERTNAEQAEREARWAKAAPLVSERLVARELAAHRVTLAIAELRDAVIDWRQAPGPQDLLADAPPPLHLRRDRDPLPALFNFAVRGVHQSLGLPLTPNPPQGYAGRLDDLIEELHAPVWAAIYALTEGSA
jgi:hypothetical protein